MNVGFGESIVSLLSADLSPKAVKQREQAGRKLSYIEGWHAIAEANRIFGFDGWTRETVEIKCVSEKARKIGREPNTRDGWGVTYTCRVRVDARGVIREGTGAGHGIDVDLGAAHESAIKEAETDAMKRALMTFGWPFGLALYDKEQEHVADAAPSKALPAAAPEMRPVSKEQWTGPRNKSALNAAMKQFSRDLEGCSEIDELEALVASHEELLEQCRKDWPACWLGEGDHRGAKKRIEERRAELNPAHYINAA